MTQPKKRAPQETTSVRQKYLEGYDDGYRAALRDQRQKIGHKLENALLGDYSEKEGNSEYSSQ